MTATRATPLRLSVRVMAFSRMARPVRRPDPHNRYVVYLTFPYVIMIAAQGLMKNREGSGAAGNPQGDDNNGLIRIDLCETGGPGNNRVIPGVVGTGIPLQQINTRNDNI